MGRQGVSSAVGAANASRGLEVAVANLQDYCNGGCHINPSYYYFFFSGMMDRSPILLISSVVGPCHLSLVRICPYPLGYQCFLCTIY